MKLPILLAAGLSLALPAAASADSIVYIDQGNVWSASPDGARKVQLTTGGNWHSPTQADDGTIAAVQGTGPIVVMARDGRPLHTITTHEAPSGDGATFAPRPVELSFSPDGTKLAYAYVASSCPPASSCGTIQRSTFYTEAGVTDATPVSVYGNQFGVSDPEWVTNRRTLVFGGFGSQVSIDDLGPGDYSQKPWMVPNGDMGDGEVSRDGKRLAVTVDYGADKKLAFFAVKGDVTTQLPPAYPDPACSTTHPDASYADPTWSPDGSGLAYQSANGIEITHFTAFGPDTCATANDSVLSATGSQPDWGPADPPASAYTPPTAPPPVSPAPPIAPRAPKTTLKATFGSVKLVKQRLVVKVKVPAAGKVTVTARLGARTVARGQATAKRAGTVTVKLSKAKTSLKRKKLTLKLSFNGGSATKRLKVA
jgi:dipeptidyl aminopeptidase/acylaminoacyl peptidase